MDVFIEGAYGSPRQIIPLNMTQHRGQHSMTLVSLERWDWVIIANIHFTEPMKHPDGERAFSTTVRARLTDDRGTMFVQGGGSGGGGRGDKERDVWEFAHTFAPVPEESTELTLTADVHFRELQLIDSVPGQGWKGKGHTANDRRWSDPDPWIFELTMPRYEDKLTLVEGELIDPPPVTVRHNRDVLPIGLEPISFLPILQQRRLGTDVFTLVAIDFFADGIQIDWMVEQAGHLFHDPMFRSSVRDDGGNAYAVWPGGGGGHPTPEGSAWRHRFRAGPALDPMATTLFIGLEAGRPNPGNLIKQFGQLDMENDAEQWLFAVPVDRDDPALK